MSKRNQFTILCISYIIGLFSTGLIYFQTSPSWQQWVILILVLIGLSILLAFFLPIYWKRGPKKQFYLLAAAIALLAVIYFQVRTSNPSQNDVSYILPHSQSANVIVTGNILTEGRLNSHEKLRFWLKVNQIKIVNETKENHIDSKKNDVTGKLYVTLPIKQLKELYVGQKITIEGLLYKPSAPSIPGAFDFKAYLARNGAYAGLKGMNVIDIGEPPWGLWQLRKRIINSQKHWLGDDLGALLSSIVLGQKAVDLPPEIRNSFTQTGLAHVLAASGFHVALLLGVTLWITRSISPKKQLIIGIVILTFYLGLTGLQPSIFRAVLMGIAVLFASVLGQKVNPLSSLLSAATIILLFNPLWIWDLGFQLSFLATFGLIVTLPPLENKLDWLPPTIATMIAIPLAASVWTFPLLMHIFSVVATYSIPVNVITAPLVTIVSLTGMISAAAALIYPLAGSGIAWLTYYPISMLMGIVKFFNHLPGSSYALGKLPLWLMGLIYLGMVLVWLHPWFKRQWFFLCLFIFTLIFVPIVYNGLTRLQITILPGKTQPVILIQDRGKIGLINGGDKDTVRYSLLPFLSQQGINHIDYAFSLNSDSDWQQIKEDISLGKLITFPNPGEKTYINSTQIELISNNPHILRINTASQTWLWVTEGKPIPAELATTNPHVLLWSGRLQPQWLQQIKPQVVIAVSRFLGKTTQHRLEEKGIKVYWTGRDGALLWTPKRGFQGTIVNHEE